MTHVFFIELVLVFGIVLVWTWYEYRKAARLAKKMERDSKDNSGN